MSRFVLLGLVVNLLLGIISEVSPAKTYKIGVRLAVNSDYSIPAIKGYLSNALNELGDVKIVSSQEPATFKISVIHSQPANDFSAFAVSHVFLHPDYQLNPEVYKRNNLTLEYRENFGILFDTRLYLFPDSPSRNNVKKL